LENIVTLVQTSLSGSKLQQFEAVIDQLKEKIQAEFDNQLGVHLASFRGLATEFFNNMVAALRAANLVCKGRGTDCLSDLGAFLSGELIREEQDKVDAASEEESTEEESSDDAGSEEESTEEESSDDAGSEEESTDDAGSEEESTDEAGSEEESTDDAGSEEASSDEAGSEEESSDDAGSEEASSEEESTEEASSEEESTEEASTEESAEVAAPATATAAAFRGAKRISKALYNEALRVYNANRASTTRPAKRKAVPKMKNMVEVPLF
jgi:hypothetical protein